MSTTVPVRSARHAAGWNPLLEIGRALFGGTRQPRHRRPAVAGPGRLEITIAPDVSGFAAGVAELEAWLDERSSRGAR